MGKNKANNIRIGPLVGRIEDLYVKFAAPQRTFQFGADIRGRNKLRLNRYLETAACFRGWQEQTAEASVADKWGDPPR